MRPELAQPFCGRCGEPCCGVAFAAPKFEPPRLCAECAIEGRFWARGMARLMVAAWMAVLLFFNFMLYAAFQAGLSSRAQTVSGFMAVWTYVMAAELMIGGVLAMLVRLAMQEENWVRSVRKRAEARVNHATRA